MTDPAERDGFSQLALLARQAAAQAPDPSADAAGRRRLIVAAESSQIRQRGWFGAGGPTGRRALLSKPLLLGGFALAAVAALALFLRWNSQPLTYEVYGGVRFAANYVEAHRDAPAKVEFSDGSVIDAQPGSRLRIDETRANGARVFVERGTASARVTHRKHSQWVFVAGPFDVRVIGTKFKLDWDPVQQAVSLTLQEGAVEVQSPVGQTHCIVRAGQRFRASLPSGTMTLENMGDAPATRAAEPMPSAARPAIVATESLAVSGSIHKKPPAKARKASQPTAAVPAARREWAALVRRGAFEDVVEAALAGDLDSILATCSAAEARALADAARYTNRSALAERSLLAIRARFPDTRHSAAAAFLLGRTSETGQQLERADRWYRLYLDEASTGELAAEALAGRMRSAATLHGAGAAESLAGEYLRRFPQGVHVEAARRLIGSSAAPAREQR